MKTLQRFRCCLLPLSILALMSGCATPSDLDELDQALGRRITSLESDSRQLGGRLQSVEKSNIEHSTRIRNLEDFKSQQAETNGKVTETIRAISVLTGNLKQMEADLVQMKVDVKKSLGLTEDFFSSSETLQTQMSQVRRRMDQSLTVLHDRLRMEREALDQAIKQIEAGKEQP